MTTGVLAYLLSGAKILLGRPVGEALWTGLGGSVPFGVPGKNVITNAFQSIGITPEVPENSLGEILYHHPKHGQWKIVVFRVDRYNGQAVSNESMAAEWFSIKAIPFDQMWPGDNVWIPKVVIGQRFLAEFWLDFDSRLTKHDVQDLK